MNTALEAKLKQLPTSPGVYFHKSDTGEVIYVGKAAVLRNRVRQYFQESRARDNKTIALVNEIADTDWVETETEVDALFLESEMVKRYKPRYNVLLRDDKSQLYVRITMRDQWPVVSFTRNPADDGAEYYGPFYNGFALKKAMRYLRRVFPYYIASPETNKRPSLSAHIGLEPHGMTSDEYKRVLRQLISYIKGNRSAIMRALEDDMQSAAQNHQFERAAQIRNQLRALGELKRRITFGDKEFLDISKDHALKDLSELLGIDTSLDRIEGYDISHMSGTNVVASMVVFTNGISDRGEYRKFKVHQRNNDFENMAFAISRRFAERNVSSWGMPQLVLIDGGKGQLDAALSAYRASYAYTKYPNLPFIGLAKKQEQIVIHYESSQVSLQSEVMDRLDGYKEVSDTFVLVSLPHASHTVKLLQRIRDESHRFAVSYHSALKRKGATSGALDDIPGVGDATRKKLVRKFGSVRGVTAATELELVEVVGQARARNLYQHLHGGGAVV